jgi:C4-dicarboxylate-specific signal transduction histidine kinase
LLNVFVREKRVELKSYPQLDLNVEVHGCSRSAARLSATELIRILSNLTNNAAEAIGTDKPGCVSISLSEDRKNFHISVSDNGPGIAADVLSKLGTPGFSQGKPMGKGLGVESAMSVLRLVGGKIQFTSPVAFNRGTRVDLVIPKA